MSEMNGEAIQAPVDPRIGAVARIAPMVAEEMAYAEVPPTKDSDGYVARDLRYGAALLRQQGVAEEFVNPLDIKANEIETNAGRAFIRDVAEDLVEDVMRRHTAEVATMTLFSPAAVPSETVANQATQSEEALEEKAKPFIAALSEKYPDMNFELVGDTVVGSRILVVNSREHWDNLRYFKELMIEVADQQYDTSMGITKDLYGHLVEYNIGSWHQGPLPTLLGGEGVYRDRVTLGNQRVDGTVYFVKESLPKLKSCAIIPAIKIS